MSLIWPRLPQNSLPVISNGLIAKHHMTPESTFSTIKALNGVRGVQLLPHSSFEYQEVTGYGDFNRSSFGFNSRGNQLLTVQKVWQQRPSCLKPIHCGLTGDRNLAERVANVLTSVPFIVLGFQAPRKNLNCKIYASSLIGVGIASSLYHASKGEWRKYLRWADYTMIATATVCLTRALRNENSKVLMAASAMILPVQPLMVSAVHTGMMEVTFAQRALQDPDLRTAYNVHKMSSLLGGALLVADDLFPETPFLHAGWHLAAAVGIGTCNKLLE